MYGKTTHLGRSKTFLGQNYTPRPKLLSLYMYIATHLGRNYTPRVKLFFLGQNNTSREKLHSEGNTALLGQNNISKTFLGPNLTPR
jgi:hypothetical protein